MNKSDFIETLKSKTGLTKNEAITAVNMFFDQMSEALAKGDGVEIRGLCSFHVKKYGSYTGRNPKTGENVKIRPKRLPFFKCGKELKDRLNGYKFERHRRSG